MAEDKSRKVTDEAIEVEPSGVLASISKAEIDVQIATAKQYPRSVEKFQRDAMTLATLDEETARSCFYVVPRDGGNIEGPSVRLAEIAASCWGNMHAAARVVDIDEKFVTSQALAWDLEKNVRIGIEVKRRITNRYGKRYSDDMIVTTSNAASSIAFRNAVFKVVPKALYKKVYEKCKQVSLGKDLTVEQSRKKTIELLAQMGAKLADVLKVCKKEREGDLGIDELITLNGMITAIKDGDTTWKDILAAVPRTEEDMNTNIDKVADDLPSNEKTATEPMCDQSDVNELNQIVESLQLRSKEVAKVLGGFGVATLDKLPKAKLQDLIGKLQEAAA